MVKVCFAAGNATDGRCETTLFLLQVFSGHQIWSSGREIGSYNAKKICFAIRLNRLSRIMYLLKWESELGWFFTMLTWTALRISSSFVKHEIFSAIKGPVDTALERWIARFSRIMETTLCRGSFGPEIKSRRNPSPNLLLDSIYNYELPKCWKFRSSDALLGKGVAATTPCQIRSESLLFKKPKLTLLRPNRYL